MLTSTEANKLVTQLKESRDKLVENRAVVRSQRDKNKEIIVKLKEVFSRFDEQRLLQMDSRGIPVRELLSYDLDRTSTDKEYHEKFMNLYSLCLTKAMTELDRERGN